MVTIVDYSISSVHHARRRLKILGAGREQHPCRHVPRHVNARGRQHGSLCLEAPKIFSLGRRERKQGGGSSERERLCPCASRGG